MRLHDLVVLMMLLAERETLAFSVEPRPTSSYTKNSILKIHQATKAKLELLRIIRDGDENVCASSALDDPLEGLSSLFRESQTDARTSLVPTINGVWREVKAPPFPGRQGFNHRGKPLYSIARLTGGMIKSVMGNKDNNSLLLCAVEFMTQDVHFVKDAQRLVAKDLLPIPDCLKDRVKAFPNLLRTFFLDTHFSIEEYKIRGVFRMEGYFFPHAEEENRLETWFTGGRCLAQKTQDPEIWFRVFGTELPPPGTAPPLRERIISHERPLVYRKDDGLIDDPALAYSFAEPWLGYQRVLYLDDDMRITVGHLGTRVVNIRVDNDEDDMSTEKPIL